MSMLRCVPRVADHVLVVYYCSCILYDPEDEVREPLLQIDFRLHDATRLGVIRPHDYPEPSCVVDEHLPLPYELHGGRLSQPLAFQLCVSSHLEVGRMYVREVSMKHGLGSLIVFQEGNGPETQAEKQNSRAPVLECVRALIHTLLGDPATMKQLVVEVYKREYNFMG